MLDVEVQNQIGMEAPVPTEATRPWPYGLSSGGMGWDGNMDDLMAGLRAEDFLGDDIFAMSYNISDFDATGFI